VAGLTEVKGTCLLLERSRACVHGWMLSGREIACEADGKREAVRDRFRFPLAEKKGPPPPSRPDSRVDP
jgi:hypothetical protein